MENLIVSLSGGKDSTAMLIKLIEHNVPIKEIIFSDTTVEFKEMYEHLDLIEEKLGVKITRLKADHDYEYYLLHHKKTRGRKTFLTGYSFATSRARWCTTLLKTKVINKYLKEKYGDNYCEAIGIALDEKHRVNKEKLKAGLVKYPLIEYGLTEKEALDLCYEHGFTWGGCMTSLIGLVADAVH